MVLQITSLHQLSQYTSDSTKFVVIDFYADWCGPCQMIAPKYATLSDTFASRYGGPEANNGCSVVFAKCNVESARDVAQRYSIRSMPTFVFIHENKEVERFSGADIGRVESVASSNLAYISRQQASKQPTVRPTPPATAADELAANPKQMINAPARYFVAMSHASAEGKKDEVEKAVKSLHAYLKSQVGGQKAMPFGTQLIPFLISDESAKVPHNPLQIFLEKLIEFAKEEKAALNAADESASGGGGMVCKDGVCMLVPHGNDTDNAASEADKTSSNVVGKGWAVTSKLGYLEDATSIVINLARIAINALTFETWHVVGAGDTTAHNAPNPGQQQLSRLMRRGNTDTDKKSPAPYNGRWHTLLLRLVRSDIALRILFSPGQTLAGEPTAYAKSLTQAFAELASPSPLVYSRWMKTGKQLELNSLLGAVLSPGFYLSRAGIQEQQLQLIGMIHPSALTGLANTAEIKNNAGLVTSQIHQELQKHIANCFSIFRELLGKKGAVRTQVLQWFHNFFAVNAGFTRQNKGSSELCSDTAMLSLAFVLVELALPVVNAKGFEKSIPTDYYADLNSNVIELPASLKTLAAFPSDGTTTDANEQQLATLKTIVNTRSVVQFGLNRTDVERVCHFKNPKEETLVNPADAPASPTNAEDASEVFPLPTIDAKGSADAVPKTLPEALAVQGVNHYAPRVHIFFMALRALSLSLTTTLAEIESLQRFIEHPNSARRRGTYEAMVAYHTALITEGTSVRKTIQFLNGAAKWLLHIIGADHETGKLPSEVPIAWKLLPQQIIDEVLTALTLVTKHSVTTVLPNDIEDIISLLLILMGNLEYFPKAHTHALFPTMILQMLHSPTFKKALTDHRWFQSNIVLGCIRTYIAMEKCYAEKTSCRYYLSVCLKRFLEEDALCYPARPALMDTVSRMLEKFTHMVTTEANSAIDEVLSMLAQMRKLEAEGKDQVDRDSAGSADAFNDNAGRRRNNNNRRRDNGNNDESDESENDNANNENVDSSYPQLGQRLKNGLLLFGQTIEVFKLLSRQFRQGVLQDMVAQQISNMLVQNISKLAGRNSVELKVKNPEIWGFKPRETLEALVECFVTFKNEKVFIQCVIESMHSVTTPENFNYALANIVNPQRRLVVSTLASELDEMRSIIANSSVNREEEELIWDDEAPENFFCALMATPLKDPVALPMNGDEKVFVERGVIRHRLLENEENPFSRQPLSVEQLEVHNAQPEVKAAVDALKAEIAAYVKAKRASLAK